MLRARVWWVATLVAAVLAGCSSGTDDEPATGSREQTPAAPNPHAPASLLYTIDHGGQPQTAAQVRPYRVALARLAAKCPTSQAHLADQTAYTFKKVDGQSTLEILRGVRRAIPGGHSPFGHDRRCANVFAGYIVVSGG